ncbi:MAG: hypothetical protein KTR16_05245 [Acidiferrobacterales bacterium]|nr:hypothetical protein [Acidiferrobacterales bacterium]
MKDKTLTLLTLWLVALSIPMQSFAIKKCQDADGNWHYGDVSVAACSDSEVTTLNDNGFIADKEAAPKTEDELKAEQEKLAAEEAERLRIQAVEDEKRRILSIYETEEDIDRQRDNQLSSVDGNIKVHEAYLKSMAARIERYESDLAEATGKRVKEKLQAEIDGAKTRVDKTASDLDVLKEQRLGIVEKFAMEKEIYLSLKEPVDIEPVE